MENTSSASSPLVELQNPMQTSSLISSANESVQELSNGTIQLQLKRNPAMLLPLEIIDTICEHLSRPDLRALRLTSRIWQASAEKSLFSVIYLKFNGTSFERLQYISGHPKLSKLVHYIHYDSRQLENVPAFIQRSVDMDNDQYLSTYWRVANAQRLVNGATARLEFVEAMTKFQEFKSTFLAYAAAQRFLSRDGNERNILRDCAPKLSNLLGIRHSFHGTRVPLWHLPRFEGPDPVSESILGNLASERSSECHWHFWNLLGAVCLSEATPRLRELQGSGFHLQKWNVAASSYVKFFGDFSALRDLDLEFCNESRGIRDGGSNFAKLLKYVPSLQALRLYFTIGYLGGHLSLDDTDFRSFHWKHLGSLSLHGFVTTESCLRRFLLRHVNTLHSLELGNVLFCQPADGEDGGKAGSWIHFFRFLNESMHLNDVNFRQKLGNGIDESWESPHRGSENDYIGPSDRWLNVPNPFDCLRYRIERFITYDEPSPFEPLSEDADLTPYFGLPWMFTTDVSWEFCKSDLPDFSDYESDSS